MPNQKGSKFLAHAKNYRMVVLVKGDEDKIISKTILYLVVLVVIVLLIYLAWLYVIRPAFDGTLFGQSQAACTTAPASPGGLTGSVSGNIAKLNWNIATNADSYILYVGNSSNFTKPQAVRKIAVKGTSIAVENLLPLTYYFRIVAVNSCGESALSVQVELIVSTWPSKLKICKKDNPLICLLMQTEGAPARMSTDCPNTQCVFDYANLDKIANTNGTLCLQDNDPGGTVIEAPLYSETCVGSNDWTINLSTGRIDNRAGLCLGADSIPESDVYNTTCSSISNPGDSRYAWVIQPV